MAIMKEKCPVCGGTIVIPEKMNVGECDSCGTQFTLSDLQRMKETQINITEEDDEEEEAEEEFRNYRTALSTDNITHENINDLCKKAEIALESEQWKIVYRYCDEIIRRDPKFAKAYLYKLLADFEIFKKEELANCKTPFDGNENYRLLMRFADTYLQTEIKNYSDEVNARYAELSKDEKYRSLCARMRTATEASQFQDIAKGFSSLKGYKDSAERYKECLSKYKKKSALSIGKKIAIAVVPVVVIAAIIIAIVVGVNAKKAEYDNSLFTIQITDKTNDEYDNSSIECVFDYKIINNSKHTAKRLKGLMTIKDADGNVLSSGEVSFSGTISSDSESNWDLSWSMTRNDNSAEVWNSAYEELVILFRITEIYFEDGTSKKYETSDIVVKEYDASYVEDKYNSAVSYYNNGEYEKAKELFEQLGDYKDSSDKLSSCNNKIYEIEQQRKEAKYQEATAKLENGDYVGAVILFKEISDYKDSQETVDYIYENAVAISLNYSAEGQYQSAVNLLEGLGYTDDWDDYNTPDDVYQVLCANKEAISGDYVRLVSLGFIDFVIPNGVTEIASGAFQNCTSLKSIVIPNTVISIGDNAFYGCSSLREVVIPDSVTTIGVTAFYGCSSLSDIELSDNLTTIAGGAFAGCNSLSSITLPNKLSVIGAQAFYGCSGIRKFMIPESVTFIGDEAFDKCNNLSEISMPAIEGFELRNMFSYMSTPSSLVRVNITSGTRLGKRFFYQCQTLSEINLPNGLEVIGEEAFSSCTATTINIPDTVREIQSEAFSYSSIKNFKLPANVTVISSSMFAYSQLTKIELHSNVSYIESGAFHNCSVSITFDGTKDEWLALDKDSLWNSGMSSYKVICDDSTFTHKPGYTDSWS